MEKSAHTVLSLYRPRERTTKRLSEPPNRIFFFQSEHSCDQKYLLPLLFSPFPGFSQPSFSGPCASCCLLELFFPNLTPHLPTHWHPEAKPRKRNSSQHKDSLKCKFSDRIWPLQFYCCLFLTLGHKTVTVHLSRIKDYLFTVKNVTCWNHKCSDDHWPPD